MSDWKAKRFWKSVSVAEADTGYGIALDGRPVRSPYKTQLIVPSRPMAEAIAEEWDAQQGVIKPEEMPLTRMANSALDKVAPQKSAVLAHLAEYAETDLLCYRAETPPALGERQSAGWDPVLDWAREALGAPFQIGLGVMPFAQPSDVSDRIGEQLARFDDFELTGLHDLIGLSGSAVLGLAVSHGRLTGAEAWALSRIDEDWQTEQWGVDDEAEEMAALKAAGFLSAERFLRLARGQTA
ncbi:ATP12 family chaperone protein [Flavimaricola marinus]|uniref:ATP12 chaperone protein n=1 Tax=Flavimaricola marinus TaxID=1819565 RepID=A0A238L9Z6_9RHOB|nr:ATP12 family protein [Flavimaricola marinus]SMY06393.1 ATP12 chaperone protein [Flavimaricola marinus]